MFVEKYLPDEDEEAQIQNIWKKEIGYYSQIYSTQYFQFFHSIYIYIIIGVILQQQKFKLFFTVVFFSILYILMIKYYIIYSFNNLLESEIDMKNIREFYLSTKKNNFFVLKNEKEAIFGFIALEAKSKDKLEIKRFIVEKTQNNENLEKLFEKAKQFAEEIKMKKMVLTCSSYEKSLIDFCSKKKFQLKNTQKIKQIESYDFEFELN